MKNPIVTSFVSSFLSFCAFFGLIASTNAEVIFSQDFEDGLGPNESVGGKFSINDSNQSLNNGTKMMGHAEAYGLLDALTPRPAYSYYELTLDLRNFTEVVLKFDFAGGINLEGHGHGTLGDGFNLVTGNGKKVNPPEGLLEPTNNSEMQYKPLDVDSFGNGTESRNIGGAAWYSRGFVSHVEKMTAEFDLSDFSSQKVTIRFQFGANAWHGGDGANFDNIVVEGTALPDTDGDGMSDNYEDANGLDKNTDDRGGDLDGDTLTNFQEFERCTDPQEADTDGDGLTDNVETDTDPLLKDSDGDTLDDGIETNTGTFVDTKNTGTDPNKFDTDGDGSSDALELNQGSDPTDANSTAEATIEILGTGEGSLLGGDLTDPEDDGETASGEDDASWNWVSIDANHKPQFENKGAFSVFDNSLDNDVGKWCCSPARENEPLHVTVEFSEPIALTHFTISSGADRPGRDPSHWQIQGSNDGETFAPIFTQKNAESIWTQRNQVAKVTLPNPSQPYKIVRYEATKFTDDGALYHQLGELEFFGIPASTETFPLTITQSDHGTATADPDMDTYPAGTEVILTATPNEGYQFSKWLIGEDEFTDNPLTFTMRANSVAIPVFIDDGNADGFVHFDNLGVVSQPFTRFNIWAGSSIDQAAAYPKATAQRFRAVETNVSSVTVMFSRIGAPGGSMIVSIHDVDNTSDNPGSQIGVIGEFEVNSAPIYETWCDQQHDLGTVTVNGMVGGLVPGRDYFVVLEESIGDLPQNSDETGPCDGPVSAWIISFVPDESPGQIGNGGPHLTDWPWPSGGFPAGEWIPYEDQLSNHSLRIRIEGSNGTTTNIPTGDFENGQVDLDPDLDTYLIGSEVTVTATPEPGFEFVKWTYGDQEFATNPATITVTAGATLTPIFAPVEPKPIDVEILPAMAIRWDSEAGQSYEVQSSPDLQNWTIEAENVEGTGDALTHFFVRDAREMYFRVWASE